MLGQFETRARVTLGQRIRREREQRGWTLEKLAIEIGVSKVSVWAWEHDRNIPRQDALKRLSTVLGIVTPLPQRHEDDPGQQLSELIAEHQSQIAKLLGVETDAVEISVTFAARPSRVDRQRIGKDGGQRT